MQGLEAIACPAVNFERLYSYRFQHVDQDARQAVWDKVAPHVHSLMGNPQKVLDPAAGRGEFIGAVPAKETWASTRSATTRRLHKPDTKVITGSIMDAELPADHFDGVFVSNFLEHLHDQEAIAAFLEKMRDAMEPGGRIADHGPQLPLLRRRVLGLRGSLRRAHPRRRSRSTSTPPASSPSAIDPSLPALLLPRLLPPSPQLIGLYLRMPAAWRLLGKQFLVIGRKPGG